MKRLPRILAVDDNALNLEILEEILEDDFEFHSVRDGDSCLEVVRDFRPDVVLLDIMLPGIDGYEVCRRIRSDSELHRVKVIMISAKAMTSERIEGYEAGANDYITKPFDKEELLAKIAVFLELRSAEELREARLAGMAEVAAGILHNVGNVLNSINVAASQAKNILGTNHVDTLVKVSEICMEHDADFATFVTEDKRGRMLPTFLREVSRQIQQDRDGALAELQQLKKSLSHVTHVIGVHQGHARARATWELASVRDLIDDAVELVELSTSTAVPIERELDTSLRVWVDSHRTVQILVNLIKNACESVESVGGADGSVRVTAEPGEDGLVAIHVTDDGAGIELEHLSRLFQHGHTTKKDGHGFGLHSSALAAKEMGGSLHAHSEGAGSGATFTLRLPTETARSEAA